MLLQSSLAIEHKREDKFYFPLIHFTFLFREYISHTTFPTTKRSLSDPFSVHENELNDQVYILMIETGAVNTASSGWYVPFLDETGAFEFEIYFVLLYFIGEFSLFW